MSSDQASLRIQRVPSETLFPELSKVPVFVEMTVENLACLGTVELIEADAGTDIVPPRSMCDAFYVLLAGEVEIRKYEKEGEPPRAMAIGTGEAFGEMGLLKGTRTGFDLVATTDSGPAFANIAVNADGTFGSATWVSVDLQGTSLQTGNIAYQNYVGGIYNTSGSGVGASTYLANVDLSHVDAAGGLIMPVGSFNFAYALTVGGSVGDTIEGSGLAGNVLGGSIGNDTFPASLDCIRPLGMFASFGSASGPIEAFNINILQAKGSLFATRPTLNTYAAKRADLLDIAKNLFDVVGSGNVKIPINQKYKLKDAVKAHQDLEGRNTTGSTILVP